MDTKNYFKSVTSFLIGTAQEAIMIHENKSI